MRHLEQQYVIMYFSHACFFVCSSTIMKKKYEYVVKNQNKKIAVCLMFCCFFVVGIQPPFAKPLVHDFFEQNKNSFL